MLPLCLASETRLLLKLGGNESGHKKGTPSSVAVSWGRGDGNMIVFDISGPHA